MLGNPEKLGVRRLLKTPEKHRAFQNSAAQLRNLGKIGTFTAIKKGKSRAMRDLSSTCCKRNSVDRWRESFLVIAYLLPVMLCGVGCTRMDRSVNITQSNDPLITNGIAYDSGVVDVSGCNKVIVPENALVRMSNGTTCTVVIEKELGVFAHPDVSISIYEKRKVMGCAYRIENGTLFLATYGEFLSAGHGGAIVRLSVEVPKGLSVQRLAGLSGPESLATTKTEMGWRRLVTSPWDDSRDTNRFDKIGN
jgi:hypothetical protein